MKKQFLSLFILVLLISACNSTKFVPEGEFLLNKTSIKGDIKEVKRSELKEYLRQTANAAVFGLFRMQLGIYNLAGKDSTTKFKRFVNKTIKRIGDEPVIYNSSLTSISVKQLQLLVENKGYMNAKVSSNVITKGKKANVEYIIKSNQPYKLRDYKINLNNDSLLAIAADTSRSLIKTNILFDVDVFNAERDRITERFRRRGYYNFSKEFLTYSVDSALNSHIVDVSLQLRDYLQNKNDSTYKAVFKQFKIRKVIFYSNTAANLTPGLRASESLDTVSFRDFILVSPQKQIIKLDALVQNTYINPNTVFSDRDVERTYSSLNSLGPIKYVNINFKVATDSLLDCYIIVVPGKEVSFSTELEGTYTDGYWGGALNFSTMHRNIFKGAETLSMQLKSSYEWQKDIWAQQLGVQLGLKIPRFMLPIGTYDFKRNFHANTEFTSALSYQYRPHEFSSINIGTGTMYSWTRQRYSHSFQLLDLNYVYFPWKSESFIDNYLNTGVFNKFNYENHFIMRIGYSGSYSTASASRSLQNFSTYKYSIETAGNLLYGLSHLMKSTPDTTGAYRLFNIQYSQYIKGEYNTTHHQIYDKNNRFVYHLGLGLAVPYGNADIIPYEKRFFSGGANSIRGWSESTLGPGVYKRIADKKRDYNQVGDIKLEMSMEYRTKLFWIIEGAFFLDAGNIWTINDYDNQLGGTFKIDSFMKQIAIAYGTGLRFDISFFIARLDLGVRLFDPVRTRREQWRISPSWNDDFAVHLAIGYPF